eukprot:COSAG03_NODE_23234_length_281_cov_2.439560_1_plen_70_part_01
MRQTDRQVDRQTGTALVVLRLCSLQLDVTLKLATDIHMCMHSLQLDVPTQPAACCIRMSAPIHAHTNTRE